MRYALAMFCPPLALLISRRPRQALVASAIFAVAIATVVPHGIGIFLDFVLIHWATHAVGSEWAGREPRAFVEALRPIPVIRD